MAPSNPPDDAPDAGVALAAVVRRLGSVERHLDQVTTRLAALESSIAGLANAVDTHLPRVQREVLATSAMVDAVAAQVAADTDSITRRLDRLEPSPPPSPGGGGVFRRLFGGGDQSSERHG